MEVSMEVEVASSPSSEKLFKLYNKHDTIAPKVNPQYYKSFTVIQGDGGVGSIKSTVYGDGNQHPLIYICNYLLILLN
ncbi:putative Bet v I/Major latex protein [Helianthus anomalus]